MKISNLEHGLGKLPVHVACTPYAVFSLFFSDVILQKIVDYTNEYAEKHCSDKPHARKWFPTTLKELRGYIATCIYMGVHTESSVPEYWNRDSNVGPLHPMVYERISETRWEQIDRFLRISQPTSPHPTVFDKLEDLSEHLRHAFKQYWTPGTHLTVDESIQRFQGRSEATVNIPSKPVPEGYKIWVLANAGYVMDWLFHAKGDKQGPIDLDEFWIKDLGFSKTQAVVLDLLKQQDIADCNKHIVWLDNLFTSARLLTILREYGFGGAGTVRTTNTKRDDLEKKQGTKAQQQQKEKNRGLKSSIADLKLEYGAEIEWGKLYGVISEDGKVAQFAWKDQQVVLFMSTVHTGKQYIERMRRRPAKTSTNARTSRAPFGDLAVKKLPIPDFIDFYNHFMNGVDVADQLRCYYNTQRIHVKTWKPLWHFLLDTAVSNSYKILNTTEQRPYAELRKHAQHKAFRMELAKTLYERSERLNQPPGGLHEFKRRELAQLVHKAPPIEHGTRVRIPGVKRYCIPCSIGSRGVQNPRIRKPLQELSLYSTRAERRRSRPPRSFYGCQLCAMAICKKKSCWNEHIEACVV